ncbi:MAG: ATP-binding protein [Promethearchaeota archaeon]
MIKTKKMIYFFFVISTTFLILNLPFFIANDSDLYLNIDNEDFIPTIIFNFSNLFYLSSLIIYIITIFQNDECVINLEVPSHINSKRGNIFIGSILKGKTAKQRFRLSIKDLEKHMFICGATGTGKSNFLQHFLINFKKLFKIPFFLVEFKGEYHFLQNKIDDVVIFWPGENFSINIFDPKGTNPIIHAERIFDILKSGKFIEESAEFSPQMEKVLVEILTKVCRNKEFQSWNGFEHVCEDYLQENKHEIPMLNQTLISIKNRIRRFSNGPLKVIFEKNNKIDILELFKNNILLDLSSIIRLGGEKEDAFFFLNMILKYLWDQNLTKGACNFDGISHLTIIEDAQYFVPQDLMKQSKLTTYLEDIALLQRGTGECLITLATRPDISKEILANNGIVLTFKNHIEKEIMCELLNLDSEHKNYLSVLEEGQCIIRINSIKEPFLLKIPYVKHEALSITEIYNNNKLVLQKKKINKFESKSKFNIKRLFTCFKKFIKKIKGNFSNQSKMLKKSYKKPLHVNQSILNDIKKENNDFHLDQLAFENLKTYITKLCKIQKEKE